MGLKSIIQISNLSGTNAASNWSFIAAPSALNENSNPSFNRTVVLSFTGLYVGYGGSSVGIPLESIMLLAAKTNPSLTWVPNFANQPSNAYVGYGNTSPVSFLTVAQDEIGGDMTYQWKFSNGTNIVNAGVYSNATTNALNISNTNGLIGQGFMLLVTNPSGNAMSNTAIVQYDPLITTQPASVAVAHPAPASFLVVASGQTALNYQWQYGNSTNITAAGVYSNVTTNTLNISNSTGLTGLTFQVLVSDTAGKQTSNTATLTVT